MKLTEPYQKELGLLHSGQLALRQDVINNVLSRGWLTKNEIIAIWGIDEDTYEALKISLSKERLIEPGPRRVGGFKAKIRRRPVPVPGHQALGVKLFETDWENAAVDRLVELLSHEETEHLLGDLLYTVRRMRLEETGVNRRGTKQELAAALIIQHGVDLFADRTIRSLVARKARVSCPRRWVPGKASALRFVASAGFPIELAGLPAEESPPDFEVLEGRIDLKPLQNLFAETNHEESCQTPFYGCLVNFCGRRHYHPATCDLLRKDLLRSRKHSN